jgi:hypothetical protein
MADKTVAVKLVGDASPLIKEFNAAAEAARKFADAADKTNIKLRKTGTESKKTGDDVKRLKSAAQAAGGRIGELAGRAEAAAAAAGPLGLAVGAAAISLTAGAAAAVNMADAAIDLTRHLGDIVERADELAALGAIIEDEDIEAVRDANNALNTMAATFDRLLVVVGVESGFAGAIEDAAKAINGFLLLLESNSEALMEFRENAKTLLFVLSGGTAQFDRTMRNLASAIGFVNEETKDLQQAQESQAHIAREMQALAELQIEFNEDKINSDKKAADKAIKAAEREFEAKRKFYEEEDRIFFDNLRAREEAQAEAAEKASIAFEDDQNRRSKAATELYKLQYSLDQQQAEQQQAQMEARMNMQMDYASGVNDIGQELLASQIRRMENSTNMTKTTLKRVFAMQKAADLAAATISTARAVMAALAYPPGPPGTIPMAAITGALGAVQIGVIAAQQPSFHIGSRAGDLAPDEVRATLTRGEAVLTRQAQAALGLDSEGVADVNAGLSGEQTIVVQYQHDRITQRYHKDAQALLSTARVGRSEKF